MTNIVLLCAQGVSTAMLVRKMAEYVKSQGLDYAVSASAVAKADEVCPGADFILLGPQVQFELASIKGRYSHCPVETIDMRSYGMLDGASVVRHVQEVLRG